MARRRWSIVAVAILVAALVTYGILYLNRGRTQSEVFPDRADGVAYVDEAVVYDELGLMTKAADLIIWGKVSAAAPGETHTYAEDAGPPETDRVLTIQVIDVIKSQDHPGASIQVVEGWWSKSVGYAIEDMPWAAAGQEGIFYLERDGSGKYAYVGTPGRVVLASDGRAVVSGGHDGDNPWDSSVRGVAKQWPLRIAEDGGVDRRAAIEEIYRTAGKPAPTTESTE